MIELTPASRNGSGQRSQARAIGGYSKRLDARLPRYSGGDLHQVFSDARLAAGEPEFPKAEAAGRFCDSNDLVCCEMIRFLRPTLVALRHAIETALVASVGHRDAQIINHASEAVHKPILYPEIPPTSRNPCPSASDEAFALQTTVLPDRQNKPKAHEGPPDKAGQADDGNSSQLGRQAREHENA